MTVEFEPFLALNGGPDFAFNEAVLFQAFCETQEEAQRVTAAMLGLLSDPDTEKGRLALGQTG